MRVELPGSEPILLAGLGEIRTVVACLKAVNEMQIID